MILYYDYTPRGMCIKTSVCKLTFHSFPFFHIFFNTPNNESLIKHSHGRSSKREKATSVQSKYQPSSSSSSVPSVIKIQQLPCTTNVAQQNQIHGASTSVASSSTECSKNESNIASNACVNKKNDKDGVDFLKILEEQVAGYNSGDEHLESKENNLTSDEWKKRDEKFSKNLSQERGLIIKEMEEDGACLFRAISYQIYGNFFNLKKCGQN